MTLRHIKIFIAVCDHSNSVTKAAEALYMAQPAVSLALKELEEYYGVRLFERISRQLFITEAGKQMREYGVHILSLFDDMEKGMRNRGGVLRVGASITIGSQFMPSYVKTFQSLHPDIEVRVCIGSSEQLESRLMLDKLDFALVEGTVRTPHLVSEAYMEDSLAAVCSASGPFRNGEKVSIEAFKNQKLLLREKGSGTREEFESAAQAAGFPVIPAWESTSTTALVNAVIQGLGVAVLPRRMVSGPLEHGVISAFEVEGISLRRQFLITYHKNKFLTQAAKAFIGLCRNYEAGYPLPKYNNLW